METKLWEAIDYLEKYGWIKGASMEQRRACLTGALDKVTFFNMMSEEDRDKATAIYDQDRRILGDTAQEYFPMRARQCCAEEDYRGCLVVTFNDHPATTFEDVKLVVTKAAIAAEEMV